jgi:hypothetical protein
MWQNDGLRRQYGVVEPHQVVLQKDPRARRVMLPPKSSNYRKGEHFRGTTPAILEVELYQCAGLSEGLTRHIMSTHACAALPESNVNSDDQNAC